MLGVIEKVTFLADEYVLDRGDLLVAVTDGVLERREGRRMLEEEGLAADLTEAGNLPAQAVADASAVSSATSPSGPQTDDMAVLAIRVTPAG